MNYELVRYPIIQIKINHVVTKMRCVCTFIGINMLRIGVSYVCLITSSCAKRDEMDFLSFKKYNK